MLKVGELTICLIPKPRAIPLQKAVLPAPKSPIAKTTSPPLKEEASILPNLIVSALLDETNTIAIS
jgi:hypothetical protein